VSVRARVVLAAAAAAAVTGGIAVAQFDAAPAPTVAPPSPEPSPSPPPPATGPIIDQQFLWPEDVGEGYRVAGGGTEGDWTFEFSASALRCPAGDGPPAPAEKHQRGLVRGSPQARDAVTQYVARFRPGDAARYLDQIQARVGSCKPGTGRSITVARYGFAGDQALLVAVYYGGGSGTNHVFVRQGDLLTEFMVKAGRTRDALQRLGHKAADRLCDGGRAC